MRLTQFAGSDEVFAFNNVTENEVYSFVRGLSFNKDAGCDKVSTRIMKDSYTITASVITGQINDSFQQSIFPDGSKSVEAVLIHEEGDPEILAN